jgi:hypothetical protein
MAAGSEGRSGVSEGGPAGGEFRGSYDPEGPKNPEGERKREAQPGARAVGGVTGVDR